MIYVHCVHIETLFLCGGEGEFKQLTTTTGFDPFIKFSSADNLNLHKQFKTLQI